MTYKLYYADGSASMGVRVLLEEIGAQYEMIQTTIDRSQPRPEDQLAMNPNGWVPVLIYSDQNGETRSMYEAAAITIYLCDRHEKAALAPGTMDSARGRYLQTLVYFSNTIQNAFQLDYYPDRFVDTSKDEISAQRRGHRRLAETWGIVNDQIGENDWVLGSEFSAVDIYLFMLTTWINTNRGHPPVASFPNVTRIAEKVMQRPSVQKVYADWIRENSNTA